jgi:hypothetical protein
MKRAVRDIIFCAAPLLVARLENNSVRVMVLACICRTPGSDFAALQEIRRAVA